MLNSMKQTETHEGDELEQTLSKQTKLETRVNTLIIKRTLTCFFAIIFGIPFFISTTYKPWLSEFVPIAKMVDHIRLNGTKSEYDGIMNLIVNLNKNNFDRLVGLKGPEYDWRAEDWN